jgi:hypothetical protein
MRPNWAPDNFGITRMARIAKADSLVGAARGIAQYAEHPLNEYHSRYTVYLALAATIYRDVGFRLLAGRVSAIANNPNIEQAWQRFDRLNAREQLQ